jgi:hypothetical protein
MQLQLDTRYKAVEAFVDEASNATVSERIQSLSVSLRNRIDLWERRALNRNNNFGATGCSGPSSSSFVCKVALSKRHQF